MTRILHLSDPHFGTEVEPVVQALLRLSDDLRPDLVLLGGDITQRARRAQFAAARRFVQALQRPVLAVPGNHDIPLFNVLARLVNPYGAYRRAMGPVLEPVLQTPSLLAIGVNSTRPSRHERGQVDARQIARVANRLSQASPDCLRLVLLHHPVKAVVASDYENLLIGREAAISAWVDAGVDLILGGHIHLPYVLPVAEEGADGIEPPSLGGETSPLLMGTAQQNTMAGAAARQAWVVQAGTAVSRRVRGGTSNSVNVIEHGVELGQHRCAIQRWDYAADLDAFACVDSREVQWYRNGG